MSVRWLCEMRMRKVPISGTAVQAAAMDFAKQLKIEGFKAFNGAG